VRGENLHGFALKERPKLRFAAEEKRNRRDEWVQTMPVLGCVKKKKRGFERKRVKSRFPAVQIVKKKEDRLNFRNGEERQQCKEAGDKEARE